MATAIIMPRQGQSVESCILVQWTVKKGDTVAEGQTVASIETDKATFDVPSPAAGTILELFFEEGADIPVLTNIAAVGAPGEDISALRPGGSAPVEATPTPQPASAVPTSAPPVAPSVSSAPASAASGVSPRARKAADQAGIDAASLAGSGPGGRVIERDVKAAAATAPALSPAAKAAMAAGAGVPPARGSGPAGRVLASDLQSAIRNPQSAISSAPVRADRTIPVKGVRKIVAERMRQSLSSTAQLTLNARFNASVLQSYRARAKANGEAFGLPKLTINDLICYAVVRTLDKHPALNAHFLGDKIVEFGAVHLGVAVDTPRGLMVPVVQHASAMPVGQLSAAIRSRADDCQKGSINPDLLAGGTFTITNLGSLGVETFTPVLNAPEVAILGVGGLTLMPVRRADGSIEHVDAIGLSLTVDHQAVDGAPAARFLQDLVKALENVDLLLTN